MRPLALVLALGGIGALVLAAPALRDRALPPDMAGPGGEPSIAEAAGDGRAAAPPAPAAAVMVRPVSPDIVAPPPLAPHSLERIEPREPLSPIGRVHAPSEGPPKETALHRPLVTQAGAFTAMGYTVVLAGLLPTPEDQTCVSAGVSWPCGAHARTAFRNWLRGRALACVTPPAPPAEAVVTPCRLGKVDAGEWLVAQGWAQADPADGRYAVQARAAREAGRGLYGPAPAEAAPFAVTVPVLTDKDLTGTGIPDAGPEITGGSGG
ncbi:MAG: thermonuclease family protein [Rhodobacteraceae bacterium]|nr:thermonuclease family protein [Paracoccaceae bacterium]